MISHKKMNFFLIAALRKKNVKLSFCKLISKYLVLSDMCGQFSHGAMRIIQYSDSIINKTIKINSKPNFKLKKNILKVDGKFLFGQIVMDMTCKKLLKKKNEIMLTSVSNMGHFGRLTDYAKQLADKGIISIFFANGGGPNTTVFPSRQRIIGTNPICIGIPIKKNKNFIVDFATSELAEGKMRILQSEKKKWIRDFIVAKTGMFSRNPESFLDGGALMPFGGLKGSGLAFAVELLGGVLFSKNNSSQKNFQNYIDGNNCLIITFKKSIVQKKQSVFLKDYNHLIKKINQKKIKNTKQKIFAPGGSFQENAYLFSKKNGIKYPKLIINKLRLFEKNNLNTNFLKQ